MKKNLFQIKISDLLLQSGNNDTIKISQLKSQLLSNITSQGINGTVFLQSINNTMLLVILQDITTLLEEICDICNEKYLRNVKITNYETKFVIPDIHHDLTEKFFDTEFLINTKDETINLEEFIIQAILSENSIVKKCDNCTQKNNKNSILLNNNSIINNNVKFYKTNC